MLLTPHVAVSLAIAGLIQNPILAIPLSFISHPLLDIIPHWDDVGLEIHKPTKKPNLFWAAMDAVLAINLFLLFWILALPNLKVVVLAFFCMIAAVLPDLFYLPKIFGVEIGACNWVAEAQRNLHTHKLDMISGLVIQTAITVWMFSLGVVFSKLIF